MWDVGHVWVHDPYSCQLQTFKVSLRCPKCLRRVCVSDTGGGGAAGHENQVLVFTNDSRSVCTLTGYPGVSGLNSAGQQAVQADRLLGGDLGGLAPGVKALPVVSLAPGYILSAIVEGTDNPLGSQPCPRNESRRIE